MTTSGTANFNPSLGELVLYAYGMIGVRRTALTAEHMADARMAANLMLQEWNNRQVMLFEVGTTSVPLVQGTAVYSVPSNLIMMLDAYIETVQNTTPTDRIVTPISRSTYAAIPDKATQGPPTQYWFDRQLAATFTLWPVPDLSFTYTFIYYNIARIQDAVLPGGVDVDITPQWLRAFAAGLAAELAAVYAPEREQSRRMDAERSFQIAADFEVENAPVTIAPMLSGYFR